MRVPLMCSARLRWSWRGRERGAAAVLVALTSTIVIGFLAFVTDFGMAYSNKRGLQNGADSAALAVAQEIAVDGSPTASCAQLASTWQVPGQAIAESYFDENAPADASIGSFALACGSGNQLKVTVDGTQDSTAFFGGVLGADDDIALEQSATAVVAPARTVVGLRPFGACLGLAEEVINGPTVNHMFGLNNTDYGCGGAAGNWGMIDFDSGSNAATDAGTWITNGYDGAVAATPPIYFAGDPGAPTPGLLRDAMNSILDQEIAIPVYDLLSGAGSTSQFRVMGFLSIKVCGWRFQNQEGQSTTCFDPTLVPASLPSGGGGGGAPADTSYLQVRYAGYVPIGELSSTCFLSNTACDLGTRLFQLAE